MGEKLYNVLIAFSIMQIFNAIKLKIRYISGLIRGQSLPFSKIERCTVVGENGFYSGLDCVEVGEFCFFGDWLTLTAWTEYHTTQMLYFSPEIKIGSNCSFGSWNHISSINRIEIGDGCLTGKWVTITDHAHGTSGMDDLKVEPIKRPLYSKGSENDVEYIWNK